MAYEQFSSLTRQVIGAAIEVHKTLGPGFAEKFYAKALQQELQRQRIPFEAEHSIQIEYKDQLLGLHRLDLLVGGVLIIEIKADENGESMAHVAQLLSYLRSSRRKLGLVLNFGKRRLEIKRVVL